MTNPTTPTLRSVRRAPQPAPPPVAPFRMIDRPEGAATDSQIGRAVRDERDAAHAAIDLGQQVGHVLDLHRRAERVLEEARQLLLRAVDRPDLLAGVDWPALAVAEMKLRLLSPAVDLANRRIGHAQQSAHAATEARLQVWTKYVEKRRRWEDPNVSLTAAEERAILRELVELAGAPETPL